MKTLFASIAITVTTLTLHGVDDELHGVDTWAGLRPQPAVVNPVGRTPSPDIISLRGEWEFVTQPKSFCRRYRHTKTPFAKVDEKTPANRISGMDKPWSKGRKIMVPGVWEAQGVGEPGMSITWDPLWDCSTKKLNHIYMGEGWYRKDIALPKDWNGKTVWIKIGGIRSQGWIWVNKHPVAWVDTYCGTYKYDITPFVKLGETNRILVCVNNVLPSRKGLMSNVHRWGGIYRDIELEATPDTYIDDAWIRGDFDKREAEVHVSVSCGDGNKCKMENGKCKIVDREIRFSADGKTESFKVDMVNAKSASTNSPFSILNFTFAVSLAELRPWSPEHPNLYTGIVELVENGRIVQTRRERFGIRKLEVRGKELYLHGKPVYVRGFGDDHVYPIVGITPPDREQHRAHLAKARAAGFNFTRLHTHTELPEYFEAADELGILIQAELPYYSDMTTEGFAFDPKRDVTELWRNYRRHPSFAVYSMGNEGSFGPVLDRRLHAYIKAIDPDRLKINQDCHEAWLNPPEAADYLGGPIKPWQRGSVNPERPFVTHEYLNLCVKCDSRDESLYSGVWQPPATRKGRAEWLAKFGLGMEWGDRLQDSQHVLQRHYQKEGVESARRDPYCDGYIFWTIVDVVVEQSGAYTAQGLFNPFWEQKRGGFSAEEFARFNSPSCVLLDTADDNRVFTSGDTLAADFLFANFGEGALKNAMLEWNLSIIGRAASPRPPSARSASAPYQDSTVGARVPRDRSPIMQGRIPLGAIPIGPVRKAATVNITFPDVDKPVKATLTAKLGDASNCWDFWVFPKRTKRDGSGIAVPSRYRAQMEKRYEGLLTEADAARAKVVIAEYGSQMAVDALARGQRVIALSGLGGKPNVKLGWWWMGRQVGTAIAEHPALAALPHEGALTPLFFRLVLDTGKYLPYAGLSQDDMLIVGEGGDKCYLYLAQANIGRGSAMMGFGLNLLGDTPEATALMDGLIDYVSSPAFAPKSRVEMKCLPPQNGWCRTIRAGERSEKPCDLMDGFSGISIARATDGKAELVWETQPVPQDVRKHTTFDFTFAGGMGYPLQPKAAFKFLINGKKIIDIPELVWKDHEWKGDGCILRYKRDASTAELGYFTLTVPSAMLEPGKPATLGATADDRRSLRWFAVLER